MCKIQACSKESHFAAVKKIFRYLVGTKDIGLWYSVKCNLDLVAYTDSDFVRSELDWKSTSGYCQFLGGCLVSWVSKKQHSVALSTSEAEYVVVGSCAAQVLWIKHQLHDYYVKLSCVLILCDNTSAICLTKNLIQHSKTKHIEIRHHFLRDEVNKNTIALHFVEIEKQIADVFTKFLCNDRFSFLRRELGLCNPPK